MDKKIFVAGAGSIGCYVGGRLAAGGADVTLLLRPWLQVQLDTHGIHISHLHGDSVSNPDGLSWTANPADLSAAEIILVTVKSGATESICQTILQHAPTTAQIVSLQNGVDNLPKIKRVLPEFDIIGGMVPYNVVQLGEGKFRQATSGDLWIGDGGAEVAEMFTDYGVLTRYQTDFEAVHWGKLLLNLNNPIQTLSGLTLKEELSRRQFRMVLAGAMDEALAVYQSAGIVAQPVTKIPIKWLPAALRLPDRLFSRVAKSTLDVDPAAQSSMWEDLQKGRKTEIEEINGVIVELGKRYGVPTPINQGLVDAIKAAETCGLNVVDPREMLNGKWVG
ncbi:MAG: 2-dehydropantoate 2-reductase [Chloroflexota bacterium]